MTAHTAHTMGPPEIHRDGRKANVLQGQEFIVNAYPTQNIPAILLQKERAQRSRSVLLKQSYFTFIGLSSYTASEYKRESARCVISALPFAVSGLQSRGG